MTNTCFFVSEAIYTLDKTAARQFHHACIETQKYVAKAGFCKPFTEDLHNNKGAIRARRFNWPVHLCRNSFTLRRHGRSRFGCGFAVAQVIAAQRLEVGVEFIHQWNAIGNVEADDVSV